jgi:murein L,D-transpeptidase YcbB/YkuD
VEGVARFQARHGLEPDGVLGRGTQQALGVPLRQRVRQIELALERLRWLPHLKPGRLLAVNIPMFQVWGLDSTTPGTVPAFESRVIVGRALDTETPVFVDEMQEVIFRPYWNVPPSILRNEILPAIARNSGYLAREDMEIVDGQGDDARPVRQTPASLAELAQGRLRVRQRPGPDNALGLVKFVFPNDDNIYMHGTPAMQLFARARRDFSHGCIRVEGADALAAWVLKTDPTWSTERITAAMQGASQLRVPLTEPIQVVLFYITAAVLPQDGAVHFAADIYRPSPVSPPADAAGGYASPWSSLSRCDRVSTSASFVVACSDASARMRRASASSRACSTSSVYPLAWTYSLINRRSSSARGSSIGPPSRSCAAMWSPPVDVSAGHHAPLGPARPGR